MAYIIENKQNYKKNQPAKSENLINIVEVVSKPLVMQDFDDELYRSGTAILLAADETKDIEIKYSDIPVKTATVGIFISDVDDSIDYNSVTGEISNTSVTPDSIDYYAWGLKTTITNPDSEENYIMLVVSGYSLKPSEEKVESRYEDGIVENGILTHKLKSNHLIQNSILAKSIADTLLDSFKIPRKDISLDWRGNLDLNLNIENEITVTEYEDDLIATTGDFKIYKQVTKYDGTLKQKTDGRKVL